MCMTGAMEIESRFGLPRAFGSRRSRGSFMKIEKEENKKIYAIEKMDFNLLIEK